jgi:uncharacterized protein (TIGR04255 family)
VTLNSKRYKNAPIVEAVIEIRVQSPPSFDQWQLKSLADSLMVDFPQQTPMPLVELGIGPVAVRTSQSPQTEQALGQPFSHMPFSFLLSKPDDSRILQLRRDGLAYSHMAPYTEWGSFRTEARPLWQRYKAACPDAKLARCGIRYINRVDIPGTTIEVHDYFALYPKIPDKLPQQDVVGMTLALQMPQPDLECMANINQIQVEPAKPGHLSFVLDIDIFRMGIESWEDSQLWTFLDKLRARKNEIFEACITERTRELIDR